MQNIGEEVNKSALERLGWHGTFKSRALWSVRDSKGSNRSQKYVPNNYSPSHQLFLFDTV